MRRVFRHLDQVITPSVPGRPAEIWSDAYVVTDDGVISAVGREPIEPHWVVPPLETVWGRGRVMLPGFVNTHHHFFQALTRGAAVGEPVLAWLYALYPRWLQMDEEAYMRAVDVSLQELIGAGVTTSLDFAYLRPKRVPHFVDLECKLATSAGMRLVLVRGLLAELEGPLARDLAQAGVPVEILLEDPDEALAAIDQLCRRYPNEAAPLIRVGTGPTAVTVANLELLTRLADVADRHQALKHVHFHPRMDERAWEEKTGCSLVSELAERGWMDGRTLWAHGTNLTPTEIGAAAKAGTAIAHCAGTVTRLGYRPPSIADWAARGLRLGIGLDGAASNDSGNFQAEIQRAYRMHRTYRALVADDGPILDAGTFLYWATVGGAECLGLPRVGKIQSGWQADLVLYRRDQPGLELFDDPLQAFLVGDPVVPEAMWVAGRPVAIPSVVGG